MLVEADEILIDSVNPAAFDRDRFEGRMERPLSRATFVAVGVGVIFILGGLAVRAATLQLLNGDTYAAVAQDNQISERITIADRGILTDRTGIPLAYNSRASTTSAFADRLYAEYRGLAHVIGFAKPPATDTSGFYFRDTFEGVDGAESAFNELLTGKNGRQLIERDARGVVVSEAAEIPAEPGQTIALSIDATLTQALYTYIAEVADRSHFVGGAGVIMDVQTGEILALTSYPEYSQTAVASGNAAALKALNSDARTPFLNRATNGLYAPGSIVKPYVAAGALRERVIDEYTQILSTGSISIPNPYDKTKQTVFKDWKAHGLVDMRHAIAVSSDVYFYEVGGGFGSQKGLGIVKLDDYFRLFGFGSKTGLLGFSESQGTIPTPEWKAEAFPDDPTWRIGNTYHTSIGQYGMQVTPLQAVRAVATIANRGTLLTPTLVASSTARGQKLPIDEHAFMVVEEGMRLAVRQGTAAALNVPFVEVAGKTGTAQIGVRNEHMNSWVNGFFPYDNPRYAFAVVLERAPAGTLQGAPAVMGLLLNWMHEHTPQYFEGET